MGMGVGGGGRGEKNDLHSQKDPYPFRRMSNSWGRNRSLRRCRTAGTRRITAKRTFIKVNSTGVSRVIEQRPASRRYRPIMCRLLAAVVVALALLCFFLDPRDRQSVLFSEGLHPHPGPDGSVKKEVDTIEKKVRQREEAEDANKKMRLTSLPLEIIVGPVWKDWMRSYDEEEGEADPKEYCKHNGSTSPPLVSLESTSSSSFKKGEGKEEGKRKKGKGENQKVETSIESKSKCPKLDTENNAQAPEHPPSKILKNPSPPSPGLN